jgi:hypothetical protein
LTSYLPDSDNADEMFKTTKEIHREGTMCVQTRILYELIKLIDEGKMLAVSSLPKVSGTGGLLRG